MATKDKIVNLEDLKVLSDHVEGEVTDLKSELSSVYDELGMYRPIKTSGTVKSTDNTTRVLSPITLVNRHTYKCEITLKSPSDVASYLTLWNEGGSNYLGVIIINAGETTKSSQFTPVIDTDVAYLAFNTGNRELTYTITFTDLTESAEGTRLDDIESDISQIRTDINNIESDITQIGEDVADAKSGNFILVKSTDDITPSMDWTQGYVNKTGYVVSSSTSYKKTKKIDVKEGEVYKTTSTNTPYRYVCAYYNNAVVSDKSAENTSSYTVPNGVDQIIITAYSNQDFTQGTVYKVYNKYIKKPVKESSNFRERRPMITFIDDDGYASFYQYIYPIMQDKEIPYCVAFMGDTDPAMTKPNYLTKEQCDAIVNAGGEIVVHGGINLTEFSTIELAEENVVSSKEALASKGFYSDVYVYPNSGNNIAIREMIEKHFDCAFKTAYPQKYDTRCNDKCVPSYFIHRSSCGGYYDDKSANYGNYDTWTMDYFRALIDDTIAKNGWLVFMTHVWMMPIGCAWRQEHDADAGIPSDLDEFALLESIIDYAQSQNVDIVTASEGFEVFGNAMQAGDYLGYWNENTTPATGYEHTTPGSAINKIGQYDFPSSNNLNT